MFTEIPIPEILTFVLIGTLIVGIIMSFGGSVLFFRRLKTMQQTILQLHAAHSGTQNTVHLLQISTQEHIQQLQIAQASTQATVTATQQETQRFVQDLQALQHTSQALMLEIKTLQGSSQALMVSWQKETTQLSRALRTTYQQGTWGEHELRRVVELAGMVRHCDFDIQSSLSNGQKPDVLIHMHNNRSIAVDAKAPSQAYLEAMSCEDENARVTKLKAYARHVRDIMLDLAGREYWKQLQPAPALVILFLPNEAMFRAALEYDLTLLDMATEKNVLLASPVTLIALLKAIAYGWSQEYRAQNVQQIVDQSKELHKELETWLHQWQALKKAIQTTSAEFSRVATRYETHVLPIIKALGMLDSTLLIKEKAFELKPLQIALNTLEEEKDPLSPLKEESEAVLWQDLFTKPLKKLREILSLDILGQEKEKES